MERSTMSDVCRWHSPHPGTLGALARIPGEARRVALELDGTATTAREAVDRVRAAVGKGYAVSYRRGCICLMWPAGDARHCWRVVRGDRE